MKPTKIIPALLATLLALSAHAQLPDWRAVQILPAGTKIHVTLKHGRTFGHCFFDGASDDQLACSVRGGFYSRRKVYARDNVKAVFRAHNGTLIGLGVGASTGAALGAARSDCCRGGNALISAVALGAVGAVFGTALDPFFHGKAVYRSPNYSPATPQKFKTPDPNPEQNTAPPQPKIPCLRDGTTLQCVDQ
jgi:hypothetical protein